MFVEQDVYSLRFFPFAGRRFSPIFSNSFNLQCAIRRLIQAPSFEFLNPLFFAMAGVPAHTARLIVLFVSCVLYGILLTTFVPCIRSLIFAPARGFQLKRWRDIKYPVVAATLLMFFFSTFSAVLAMDVVMDGFIRYDGPGGPPEFYANRNVGWKHWMLAAEDGIQVVVGDAFLIYRCFVIYDRNWRTIALPAFTWLSLTVVSALRVYHEALLPAGKHLDDPSVLPFLSALFVLTFATSVITTCASCVPSLLSLIIVESHPADLIIRRLVVSQVEPKLLGQVQPHILSNSCSIPFASSSPLEFISRAAGSNTFHH
ncbi:hypothetical protein C8J57DRAFT_1209576 [Mycena rebaudengoi]|nr:hypothetical protein C8J57DRAFT_1209576 [Mycena rebaudengoi]